MLNFIKSSQHLEFDFIGVKMIKGTVNFYYPDTINIPENEAERLKLAQNLLKLIRITKVNYESGSTNREFSSNFDFAFEAYEFLIKHFQQFRKFPEFEKKSSDRFGSKISWKKTLKVNDYLIIKNQILPRVIIKDFYSNSNSFIQKIYQYCVIESFALLGWLFGYNSSISSFPKINKVQYIKEVNRLIMGTFNEQKKLILLNMKRILAKVGSSPFHKQLSFGINNFNFPFEYMINELFSNIVKSKKFFPYATWILNDKQKPASKLKPDTSRTEDQMLIVIDAKYYTKSLHNGDRILPQTSDILKQAAYKEFLKNSSMEKGRIINLFVLPELTSAYKYDKMNNDINENFRYLGHANLILNKQKNIVDAFTINMDFLINNYGKKSTNIQFQLTSIITKHSN
jgi:hypothetical protein